VSDADENITTVDERHPVDRANPPVRRFGFTLIGSVRRMSSGAASVWPAISRRSFAESAPWKVGFDASHTVARTRRTSFSRSRIAAVVDLRSRPSIRTSSMQ